MEEKERLKWLRQQLIIVFYALAIFSFGNLAWWVWLGKGRTSSHRKETIHLDAISSIEGNVREAGCLFSTCFNVYRCGGRLSVYLYPMRNILESETGEPALPIPSREFLQLRHAIATSKYATTDPDKACIFVPDIDTLNQNRLPTDWASKALHSSPLWNGGENHIIFSLLPGAAPDYNETIDIPTGRAVLAGSGFSWNSYRTNFDISIPVFNPIIRESDMTISDLLRKPRPILLTFFQPSVHSSYKKIISKLPRDKVLVLDWCDTKNFNPYEMCSRDRQGEKIWYRLPDVLEDSKFCLIISGPRLGQTALSDALQSGCIPIVVSDDRVLPFSEVLDWKRISIQLYNHQLPDVIDVLSKDISQEAMEEMRQRDLFVYEFYFRDMRAITHTALQILEARIFPLKKKPQEEWNDPPNLRGHGPPLVEDRPTVDAGFTAVILAYDRVANLFKSITHLGSVPSLRKILIVWNNPTVPPPQKNLWPTIEGKSIEVVISKENKLANRFRPYRAIETEAVFSIDDDIAYMIHPEEIEFAYQVWREFPSHLVGFPSRLHVYSPETREFLYNSEWTNNVSMILTGAAFYHKHYGYLYWTKLPQEVGAWVERKKNCEDIAMNFLIASFTGQPALKVSPRKKFRCPECTGVELPADSLHLTERSECIGMFTTAFGGIPLKTTAFRMDPHLFKNPALPDDLRLFPAIKNV